MMHLLTVGKSLATNALKCYPFYVISKFKIALCIDAVLFFPTRGPMTQLILCS